MHEFCITIYRNNNIVYCIVSCLSSSSSSLVHYLIEAGDKLRASLGNETSRVYFWRSGLDARVQ